MSADSPFASGVMSGSPRRSAAACEPRSRRLLLLVAAVSLSFLPPGCAARHPDPARRPAEPFAGIVATTPAGSWFTPCGAAAGARMWVTYVDAAVRQAQDARAGGLLAEGSRTFVRWRASRTDERLVGPGGPALLVHDIFEIRAPRADDCAGET